MFFLIMHNEYSMYKNRLRSRHVYFDKKNRLMKSLLLYPISYINIDYPIDILHFLHEIEE